LTSPITLADGAVIEWTNSHVVNSNRILKMFTLYRVDSTTLKAYESSSYTETFSTGVKAYSTDVLYIHKIIGIKY
jgi:hypothetical protein